MVRVLPVPTFYNPKNSLNPKYARSIKNRPLEDLAEKYRRQNNVTQINWGGPRINLTLVDMQGDFCDPHGSLSVAGAMNDQQRLVEFIYKNLEAFWQIILTADSHPVSMVTTPNFIIDSDGNHPKPIETTFSEEDFTTGRWKVKPSISWALPGDYSPEFINEFLAYYCRVLKEMGRPDLRTWPVHCPTSTYGQRLMGALVEAVTFHEYVRGTVNPVITKGESPYLECFSALGPDILTFHDGTPIPLAQKNTRLLEILRQSDAWVVGGEASTHCVPATVLRVLDEFPWLGPQTYYLKDGMSPVTGLEFLATEAEAQLHERSVNFVTTDMPMRTWPGIMRKLIKILDRAA